MSNEQESNEEAYAEAVKLTWRTAAFASGGDCAKVYEAAPRVRALDANVYELAFVREPTIARCLRR